MFDSPPSSILPPSFFLPYSFLPSFFLPSFLPSYFLPSFFLPSSFPSFLRLGLIGPRAGGHFRLVEQDASYSLSPTYPSQFVVPAAFHDEDLVKVCAYVEKRRGEKGRERERRGEKGREGKRREEKSQRAITLRFSVWRDSYSYVYTH